MTGATTRNEKNIHIEGGIIEKMRIQMNDIFAFLLWLMMVHYYHLVGKLVKLANFGTTHIRENNKLVFGC